MSGQYVKPGPLPKVIVDRPCLMCDSGKRTVGIRGPDGFRWKKARCVYCDGLGRILEATYEILAGPNASAPGYAE